jgi:hypothetical protein
MSVYNNIAGTVSLGTASNVTVPTSSGSSSSSGGGSVDPATAALSQRMSASAAAATGGPLHVPNAPSTAPAAALAGVSDHALQQMLDQRRSQIVSSLMSGSNPWEVPTLGLPTTPRTRARAPVS